MKKKSNKSNEGWDLSAALISLRTRMDPYIWEQGQELFLRGAAEDFSILADSSIQVKVVDPRDARAFFVNVKKLADASVSVECRCPYRLGDQCRHQVVALEYLHDAAERRDAGSRDASAPSESAESSPESDVQAPAEPLLYRLFDEASSVATSPDGSLLRLVLNSVGSSTQLHRIGLQLFTGTGWTDLRTGDVERWIQRGPSGPHPRDALLAAHLVGGGRVSSEIDSETLATLLSALTASGALVDRMGNTLEVSPWPWYLAARLVPGEPEGLGVEFTCRSREGGCSKLDEVCLLPSVRAWIQLESGAFHPLAAGAPGAVLEELQDEDLSHIAGEDLDRFLSNGVARLEQLCPDAFETEPDLIHHVEGVDGARLQLEGTPRRLDGRLELSYGGQWVAAPATPEPWSVERDGKILRFPPAGQSLARARRELQQLGFRRHEEKEGVWVVEGHGTMARVLAPRPEAFVSFELPERLEALDLLERGPRLTLHVDRAAPRGSGPGDADRRGPASPPGEVERGPGETVSGATRTGSGISWFDVSWHFLAGDHELPVSLDALRQAVEDDPDGFLELDDGTVLGLRHDAVRSLVELSATPCAESVAGRPSLRVPVAAVGQLLETRPGVEVEFRESVQALVERLRESGTLPPPELRGDLRPVLRDYQRQAVSWLGELERWGLGGVLAHGMGLGKTLMILTHYFGRSVPPSDEEQLPVLIVCPTSLTFNWIDECQRFFPAVRARALPGHPPRERQEIVREGADLLVTSYALLRRDREVLESRQLRAVVLDEAQFIKNPTSQTARAARAVNARRRWALTGTPVENHLGELWSLLDFLMPGSLGSHQEFAKKFAEPIRRGDDDALATLRTRVRPFILRRTKIQVLDELPPLIEQVERAPLSELQRQLYEEHLLAARTVLEDAAGNNDRFKVLAALTRLRQICCHPRLVLNSPSGGGTDPRRTKIDRGETRGGGGQHEGATVDLDLRDEEINDGSGKFSLLVELLEECLEEGHRVLLFSQFTSMLDLIEEHLDSLYVRRCRLDGSTKDREAVVRRFTSDPSIPLFLISLKAGGFGLNLAQADTVILYDPWWNPAVEAQAAARAHRIGQTVPVHVHRLITAGTVEEKILELQESKRELASSVLTSDEGALATLSFEELKGLLTP